MDPIQKAVMTHTFGPPLVKTKRPIISCNVCQIRFNSEVREAEGRLLCERIYGPEGQTAPFIPRLRGLVMEMVYISVN